MIQPRELKKLRISVMMQRARWFGPKMFVLIDDPVMTPEMERSMLEHPNCRCTSGPIRFTMDPDPPRTLLARLADFLARFTRGSSGTIGQ